MTESFSFLGHSVNVNKLTKIDLEFGKILRKKRLHRKLTQEALSADSGLYQRVRNGPQGPKSLYIIQIIFCFKTQNLIID